MDSVTFERDTRIPMRDGLDLAGNVYRPADDGEYPVLMAFTAFGKDDMWSDEPVEGKHFPGWKRGYEPWSPTLTGTCAFEANDPSFWVPNDYAVMLVDPRGIGRSPGTMAQAEVDGPAGEDAIVRFGQWARDMFDAIEWAGTQKWSNGNVGLSGISILAFSQWRVAELNPPHLKAFNPWEGMTDARRAVMCRGGIPETKFGEHIAKLIPDHDPAWDAPDDEDPPTPVEKDEDEFLSQITLPALLSGTWSSQGCLTRGAFRAWRKIGSDQKWLYTHGRQKWAEFYTSEARTARKEFFDHFLKGCDDRILNRPPVRMEVRDTAEQRQIRWEGDFPIPRTDYEKLYLDANTEGLSTGEVEQEASVTYDAANDVAAFDFTFDEETELSGYMKASLWVAPEDVEDMDLFLTVKKLDADGNEVKFDSLYAPAAWSAAFGWLRLSHRELDDRKSTEFAPTLKKVVGPGDTVEPGEPVPCTVPIQCSSTLFREDETLRLVIAGTFQGHHQDLPYEFADTVNQGEHTVYTGGEYLSYLQVPKIPNE